MSAWHASPTHVVCPACLSECDHTLSLGGPLPEPGHVSLCAACLTWAVYGDDLQLHRPPAELALHLGTDPECVAVLLDIATNREVAS